VRVKYVGFELIPNSDGGQLVYVVGAGMVSVLRKHPDKARWWQQRAWDKPDDSWRSYPTMRQAAQAGYDERPGQ
jgi:predicted NUDIX family NTP pyrophosphohydrolase